MTLIKIILWMTLFTTIMFTWSLWLGGITVNDFKTFPKHVKTRFLVIYISTIVIFSGVLYATFLLLEPEPPEPPKSTIVAPTQPPTRPAKEIKRPEPRGYSYPSDVGYVVVSSDEEYVIRKKEDFQNTDYWTVPTYRKDKQFMVETGVRLPHKTKVNVKDRRLHEKLGGRYEGFILVELLENGEQYYIDVQNFVNKPYWTYTDNLLLAAQTGAFIAEYHQVSDLYPFYGGNEIYRVYIPDGALVLVSGTKRIYPYDEQIKVIAYKKSISGSVESHACVHPDDLTIIY